MKIVTENRFSGKTYFYIIASALVAVVTLMCHKRTNPDKECTYNSLGLEYAFFRLVQVYKCTVWGVRL